ncbi:hypothetical protein BU17DRAFT_36206 [Hysterangium stoloniferum]|nr:hypothetical protein BU17DRAFT_36206 [Hysterangium stoloniferum]
MQQLRTGHMPLNKHFHRIGTWETPFRDECKTKDGTPFHYVIACPKYRTQRDKMRSQLP